MIYFSLIRSGKFPTFISNRKHCLHMLRLSQCIIYIVYIAMIRFWKKREIARKHRWSMLQCNSLLHSSIAISHLNSCSLIKLWSAFFFWCELYMAIDFQISKYNFDFVNDRHHNVCVFYSGNLLQIGVLHLV